ncbi:HNH endonuclease, partial [Sphingobium sp. DC-2]|uniref:HNH endonuclease n=1 Tax=Sphingobium sp. DC-2 TaxID=1303256 RepID=UPI0004C3D975
MAESQLPNHDVLRQLLRYNPETGELFWIERGLNFFPDKRAWAWWNGRNAGNRVSSATGKTGYLLVKIFAKRYLAHRVAWAVHYAERPPIQIDHINGIRHDNRIGNLRSVTAVDNQRNMKRSVRNTSGVTGVCYNARRKMWSAYISFNGAQHKLGLFSTLQEAASVRRAAEVAHDYHKNHGRR